MTNPIEPLLTRQDVLTLLGIAPTTLVRWMSDGLPYLKFGRAVRFRRSSLDQWLSAREVRRTTASGESPATVASSRAGGASTESL